MSVPEAGAAEPGTFEDWLRAQRDRATQDPENLAELRRLAAMTAADGRWPELAGILDREGIESERLLEHLHLCLLETRGEAKELLRALYEKERKLRASLGVRIARAEFCKKVLGFRRYLPVAEPRFKPGSSLLLYVEIENFTLSPWNGYETLHLRYDWKLADGRGRPLTLPTWDNAAPEEREDKLEFRGALRDFHQSFGLPLPKNLPGGEYVLTVTVEDVSSKTTDRGRIPFEVVFE
ncbi:MAG TPA: hypothetical protein VI643_06410 [Planctomycetota bacterium]|nr:hypothetical protein [Planctomycetota bacterium]